MGAAFPVPGLVAHMALGALLEVFPKLVLSRADWRRPRASATFSLAIAGLAAFAIAASLLELTSSLGRAAKLATAKLAAAFGSPDLSGSETTSQRHFLEALVSGGVSLMGSRSVTELLGFLNQIRGLFASSFDMLGGAGRRQVARLIQIVASQIGGVALAPSTAAFTAEIRRGSEGRLDH